MINISDIYNFLKSIIIDIINFFRQKRINNVEIQTFVLQVENDRKMAKKILSTIEVYGITNKAYGEGKRDLLKINDPLEYMDAKVKANLNTELLNQFIGLSRMIRDHNAEMQRFGGAFGADSYRNILINRLLSIMFIQEQILKKFTTNR